MAKFDIRRTFSTASKNVWKARKSYRYTLYKRSMSSSTSELKNEAIAKHSSTYGELLKQINTLKINSTTNKNCLCAPTVHAGSFRCRFHRRSQKPLVPNSVGSSPVKIIPFKILAGDKTSLKSFPANQKNVLRRKSKGRPSRLSKVSFALQSDCSESDFTGKEETVASQYQVVPSTDDICVP